MTPEQFCYWLNGILEIQVTSNNGPFDPYLQLNSDQLRIVYKHLQSVFVPVVPRPSPIVQPYISSPGTGGAGDGLPAFTGVKC